MMLAPQVWLRVLTRPVAAVDVQALLRDVIGVGGGEKDRGTCDVLRLLDATQRDGRRKGALWLSDLHVQQLRKLPIDLFPEGRVDDTRRDGVDVYFVGGECQSDRLVHADDACLAGAVREDQRLAPPSRLGGQVNDLAAAALLDHHLRR